MILTEQAIWQILTEYREAIAGSKYKEEETEEFLESVADTLLDYYTLFPEGTEFEYRVQKRFRRQELRITIFGEKKDIFEYGEKSKEREVNRWARSMRLDSSIDLLYRYLGKGNVLVFFTPPPKKDAVLKNPMIIASLIGIVLGLLCLLLPANITDFLVDDLASPVLNVAVKILSGIMGPIIFFSLVTAIGTANSVSEINRLTSKLFIRFLLIAISLTVAPMVVSFILFSLTRGQTDLHFSLRTLVDMLLGVFPNNLVKPFAENNFPQILVLGIVMGVALLLLNGRNTLSNILIDIHDWINELLRLVLKITPIIPGLTLFRLFARKDFDSFLQGWKFIVGAYICMAIVLLIKMIKTKLVCKKLSLSLFLKKTGPLIKTAFLSGSEIVALKPLIETVEGPLAIKKSFSSLWVPLNQAMLAPVGPIYYVLAPFFIAEITGTPVSIPFFFILLIMTVQLSLAYPGIVAGNTIIFSALGLSTDYVGLFSAYSVFIKNASAAYGMLFRTMEVTEAAYKMQCIDMQQLSKIKKQ